MTASHLHVEVAQQWFDALGGSLYIAWYVLNACTVFLMTDFLSMFLETGIFLSQAVWLWRVRHIRREAKKAGKTYDEYVAETPAKKIPRCESSDTVVDVEACHEPANQVNVPEKTVAELEEKEERASGSETTVAKPVAVKDGFRQKWDKLVLRPTSDAQP